jgi:transcription elongation factor Elf1
MIVAEVEVTCKACGRVVHVAVPDVLVQVDADTDPNGRLIVDCPLCGEVSLVEICLRTVASLLLAGAAHVQRLRTNRDEAGSSAEFTAEDWCTWHDLLRTVSTVAPWE